LKRQEDIIIDLQARVEMLQDDLFEASEIRRGLEQDVRDEKQTERDLADVILEREGDITRLLGEVKEASDTNTCKFRDIRAEREKAVLQRVKKESELEQKVLELEDALLMFEMERQNLQDLAGEMKGRNDELLTEIRELREQEKALIEVGEEKDKVITRLETEEGKKDEEIARLKGKESSGLQEGEMSKVVEEDCQKGGEMDEEQGLECEQKEEAGEGSHGEELPVMDWRTLGLAEAKPTEAVTVGSEDAIPGNAKDPWSVGPQDEGKDSSSEEEGSSSGEDTESPPKKKTKATTTTGVKKKPSSSPVLRKNAILRWDQSTDEQREALRLEAEESKAAKDDDVVIYHIYNPFFTAYVTTMLVTYFP
jgi:hypothetical protein